MDDSRFGSLFDLPREQPDLPHIPHTDSGADLLPNTVYDIPYLIAIRKTTDQAELTTQQGADLLWVSRPPVPRWSSSY